MVSGYLSLPVPHTLLIGGTMEKLPLQQYNVAHFFSVL